MRIAVYENLPPGGALRASYEIGRRLQARGHDIDVFRITTYSDKGPWDLVTKVHSVRVLPYRPLFGALSARLRAGHLAPRSYTLFGPLMRLHRRLAAEIRVGNYDAVWLHSDPMTFGPYVLRWLAGIPTLYYCHEPPRLVSEAAIQNQHQRNLAGASMLTGAIRQIDDRLVSHRLVRADYETTRLADIIMVNSVYTRERVWAAYERNAVVCYSGIDPDQYVPDDAPRIRRREVLSIGSPVSLKGHQTVLEAIGTLEPLSRPNLRILLPRPDPVGVAMLEQTARSLEIEMAIEVALEESEVVERFQNAIATVCVARLEPFGLTALESMGCGTPVVAIREGGFRESVVDGSTGILVEPTLGAIAAGIRRLCNEPKLAARMGKAGRDNVAKRWTWERTSSQVEHILQEAVGSL